MNTLLLAAFLIAPGARAQVASVSAPPHGFGITVEGGEWVYREFEATGGSRARVLDADERGRLSAFFASHAGSDDYDLSAPLYAVTMLDGRDPAAAGWFTGEGESLHLTPLGRNEIPEAVLVAYADPSRPADAARTSSSAMSPEDAALKKAAAIGARLPDAADGPDFDGSARRVAGSAALPAEAARPLDLNPLPKNLRSSSLPDAPSADRVPAPNPHARRDSIEDKVFWSSWWGYHAAWAADFTTTAMILKRGGYETDPLYTHFGNKNMAGVIGSAVVVHIGTSIAGVLLHDEAKKYTGFKHYALEAAAILINGYGIGVHSHCAAQNADLLQHWP